MRYSVQADKFKRRSTGFGISAAQAQVQDSGRDAFPGGEHVAAGRETK
jgi:hypothetical protein